MAKKETLKVVPRDPKNFSPIYVSYDEKAVSIMGDSFGEPDPYKMVTMAHHQFEELKNISVGDRSLTIADYEEANQDKRRICREIDKAMFGEGGAKQPALCDIQSSIASFFRLFKAGDSTAAPNELGGLHALLLAVRLHGKTNRLKGEKDTERAKRLYKIIVEVIKLSDQEAFAHAMAEGEKKCG